MMTNRIQSEAVSSTGSELPAGHAPEDELDLWWGSPSLRKHVPEVALCLIVTVMVYGLSWYLRTQRDWQLLRPLVLWLLGPFWLGAVLYWSHTLVANEYRLTTRRLLAMRGLRLPVRQEVLLTQVTQVLVERKGLDKWAGTGRIRVLTGDRPGPMVLGGLYDPQGVAMLIRKQLQTFQDQGRLE